MTTFPSHARSVTLESAAQVALKLKYTPPAHFRFRVTCIGSKILIMALSYATRVEGGGRKKKKAPGMKIVCFAIVSLWLIQGAMCKNTPTCQLVVKCVLHKLWIIEVWGARREPRGGDICWLCALSGLALTEEHNAWVRQLAGGTKPWRKNTRSILGRSDTTFFFSFSSWFEILDIIHSGHVADVVKAAVTSHISARWGECHPSRQLTSRGVACMTTGRRLAPGVRNVTKGAL